jgi:hypothetical protein
LHFAPIMMTKWRMRWTRDRLEMYAKFWNENWSTHLGELGIDGRTLLNIILRKENGRVWTEYIWLRTGTSGRLLWTQQWISWFHKRWTVSCLSEQLFI